MAAREVTPDFSVSEQITADEVAGIKAAGFRSIMCNRPDGEDAQQPPFEEIAAQARAEGLTVALVPVVSGQISEEDVAAFREALDGLPKPVLAYCRSGTRCRNLWMLAQYRP